MTDWSYSEVSLIVLDYFSMLSTELQGRPYSKAEHRRALSPLLDRRSNGSIEFKHQNISSVMVRMGLPYIDGYKPLANSQGILVDAVRDYLAANPVVLDSFAASPLLSPIQIPLGVVTAYSQVLVERPELVEAPLSVAKPWQDLKGRKIDFVSRDATNRQLGRLGEEWVMAVERSRLVAAGRSDLAENVDWVSQRIGDGLGFDILSFDERDESERYIEVKTTGLAKSFPFYVTANELQCSEDVAERYHLYRVFNFAKAPRMFVLQGALSATCRLDPVQYLARVATA